MRLLCVILLLFCAQLLVAQDLMRFLDGSRMQGQFLSFDMVKGIQWQSPHSRAPLAFAPEGLHTVNLTTRERVVPTGQFSARLELHNGDMLLGDVLELTDQSIVFKSWFAGRMSGPRELVRSVTFFNHGVTTIYQGPGKSGFEGWKVPTPELWRMREGYFTGKANAFIGREFELPRRTSVKFDLMFFGALNAIVSLYSDNVDRYNFISRGYQLTLGMGYVHLARGGGGPGMTPMGTARYAVPNGGRPTTFEVRLDRERAVIALLVNGQMVHRWTDPAGFAGTEKGISFLNRSQEMSLGGIHITEWDGGFQDSVSSLTNITEPVITLVNHDTFSAEVKTIRSASLAFRTDGIDLAVPMQRVRRLTFPKPIFSNEVEAPVAVQARLLTSERLTLNALNYVRKFGGVTNAAGIRPVTGGSARGKAVQFGDITLNPGWITELNFNSETRLKPFVIPGFGPDGRWTLQ